MDKFIIVNILFAVAVMYYILFNLINKRYFRILTAAIFLTALGVAVPVCSLGAVNIRPYQLPIAIMSVLLIVHFVMERTKIIVPGYALGIIMMLTGVLFSSLSAQDMPALVKQTIHLAMYIVFFGLITHWCDNENKLKTAFKAIIYSSMVAFLWGFVVFLYDSRHNYYHSLYFFDRPQSFFAEPNEFGQFMVFCFGYIISGLMMPKQLISRRILVLCLMLGSLLLVFNMSRGSWAGCIASMVVVFVANHRRGAVKFRVKKQSVKAKIFIFTGIVIAILSVGYIPAKYGRTIGGVVLSRASTIFTSRDATINIRLQNSYTAIESGIKHPLTGIGLGNISTILEEKGKKIETSSNTYIDLFCEIGILGILGYILFSLFIGISGINKVILLSKENNDTLRGVYIGALASFLGLLINGLSYSVHLLPFFWISAGILGASRMFQKES